MTVRGGQLEFAAPSELDTERAVLLVPPGESVEIFAPYFSRANWEAVRQRVVN